MGHQKMKKQKHEQVGCNFGELLLKRPLLPGKCEDGFLGTKTSDVFFNIKRCVLPN